MALDTRVECSVVIGDECPHANEEFDRRVIPHGTPGLSVKTSLGMDEGDQ